MYCNVGLYNFACVISITKSLFFIYSIRTTATVDRHEPMTSGMHRLFLGIRLSLE